MAILVGCLARNSIELGKLSTIFLVYCISNSRFTSTIPFGIVHRIIARSMGNAVPLLMTAEPQKWL